jgi:hypothetical protein
MKTLTGLLIALGLAAPAAAQQTVTLTSGMLIVWTQDRQTASQAQALTYTPTVDNVVRPPLVGVSCQDFTPTPPDLTAAMCMAPATQLFTGLQILTAPTLHTITLRASDSTGSSQPSAPLAVFVTSSPGQPPIATIPTPRDLRFR